MDKQKDRVYSPNNQLNNLFCSNNYASSKKLVKAVNFSPKYSFEKSKVLIEEYLRWRFILN